MALLLLLLALPFFLLFLLQKKRNNGKMNRLPPGPSGLPIFGNLIQFMTSVPHLYLTELSKKYGTIVSFRLGSIPAIAISSVRLSEEVMKTQDLVFASRASMLGHRTLTYNGLDVAWTPYSDYWREMRKICVVHLFNTKRVQSFAPIRKDEVCRTIQKISKISSDSTHGVVNMSEIAMGLASTLICRAIFSKRYDDEGKERSRFHNLLNEAQAMVGGYFMTDYIPSLSWVDKLTGLKGRLEKIYKELDTFYQEIIDDHLDPKREKPESEDLVDILLNLRDQRLFKFDLTFDHIKAVLMNMFVAGSDTSAASVTWAMTCLMKTPRAMKKVQEEIRTVMGKKGFVEEEDLQGLPYLKAVVKEAMRLYTAVPLLVPRETMQACTIDGYEIPAKTVVFVNAWAIGRDPEAWDKPEEFLPERFVGTTIDFRGQDFGLIPFGAGRRICPGLYMGATNVELTLSNLLYAFDWELPPGKKKEDIDFDATPGIAIHKKNPLCLVAKAYNVK